MNDIYAIAVETFQTFPEILQNAHPNEPIAISIYDFSKHTSFENSSISLQICLLNNQSQIVGNRRTVSYVRIVFLFRKQ